MNRYSLPASKVRTHFFQILKETSLPGHSFTITMEGEPKIVMMPLADFEGWQETLEVMSDKKLMKGIKEGLADIKKGKLYTEKEMKKILKL